MMPAAAGISIRHRLSRQYHFARHLRPGQVARRLWLEGQRRLLVAVHRPSALQPSAMEWASELPRPLFAPRTGRVERTADGWRFTFLNRAIDFPHEIPWSMPESGPRDQLWKMNLHYMEYLEDVDDKGFVALVLDWIDRNRPYARGYWRDNWNSYTLSLRVVVWLQQLALRRLPPDAVLTIEASLVEQLRFLERHLETDIGGNHLIKNIKALLWASACFAGPDAVRWRRKGMALLARELHEQILPDGVHFERSPSYHCQVMADLLECRHAIGQDPLGGRLDDALHRMAQATADLTHPDGYSALFGDSGLTMAYRPRECLDVFRQLFGRTITPRRHIRLPDAGYYGYREGGLYLLCDCGPICPDHLPAHGHGDALSFELSVGGQRVIVDPGVFEYNAGDTRDRSRAAASHNTVSVDGMDQGDFHGAFRCGWRARPRVLSYDEHAHGFTLHASTTLADSTGRQVEHRRTWSLGNCQLAVADELSPESSADGRASFLVAPQWQVALSDSGALMTSNSGDARLHLRATGPLDTGEGSWSTDMGHRTIALRLHCPVARSSIVAISVGPEVCVGGAFARSIACGDRLLA